MSVEPIVEYYGDTDWAQEFQAIGREEGRERMLLALLRVKCGADIPEPRVIATRLAAWPEIEVVEAITMPPA